MSPSILAAVLVLGLSGESEEYSQRPVLPDLNIAQVVQVAQEYCERESLCDDGTYLTSVEYIGHHDYWLVMIRPNSNPLELGSGLFALQIEDSPDAKITLQKSL